MLTLDNLRFSVDEKGEYSLKEYRTAETADDIRSLFPGDAAKEALDSGKYADSLKKNALDQALAYLNNLQKN